jgi:hypothetical protein
LRLSVEDAMATIALGPLSQFLDDAEIKDLMKALKKVGVAALPDSDEAGGQIADDLDEDVFVDFLDRLDAEEAAADLYLPVEFEGVVEVGGIRVGSAPSLLDILDEIKDDLDVAGDDDDDDDDDGGDDDDDDDDDGYEADDDDDDDDLRLKERQLRLCWKSLQTGATAAVARGLPLYVKS